LEGAAEEAKAEVKLLSSLIFQKLRVKLSAKHTQKTSKRKQKILQQEHKNLPSFEFRTP